MKKITWRVIGGNPEHTIPEGAVVVFESETSKAIVEFDENGEIRVVKNLK